MPRFFNNAGPVKPEIHHTIDPLHGCTGRRSPGLWMISATLSCTLRSSLITLTDYLEGRERHILSRATRQINWRTNCASPEYMG